MKTAREILLFVVLLLLSHLSEVRADGFVLLDSYPAPGQIVTAADLLDHPIYLKFSHPINRYSVGVVRLIDKISSPSICPLDACGLVVLEEKDTKLVWHPRDPASLFQPGKFFAIQIGVPDPLSSVPPLASLFKDVSGNTLPVTQIDFGVDKCQPLASLKVTDNNVLTLPCSGLVPYYAAGSGYAVTLTAGISNPSCGVGLTVEGKVWLKLPDGSLKSVLDPFTTVQLNPGDNISVDLLNHTFGGGEPAGYYEFRFRLLNPVTGEYYSAATTSFSFGFCPSLH